MDKIKEPSEIRVGNWVNAYHDRYAAYDVKRIDIYDIHDFYYHEFEGIPLTVELLEKNGYRPRWPENKANTIWDDKEGKGAIATLSGGSFRYLLAYRAPLKYVHHLQNLYYAMEGEELNFELK